MKEAGPELDAFVAEEIMGWRHISTNKIGLYWDKEKRRSRMIFGSVIHKRRVMMDLGADRLGDEFVFAPSRDMAAALDVVEKMRERGLWVSLSASMKGHGWVAAFGAWPGVSAMSAPLAVCLAAVKAHKAQRGKRK